MTDRINALVVVLDKDVRDDDVESLRNAILHLRHVIQVKKNVSDVGSLTAESRVKSELKTKLLEVLKED